MLVAYTTAAAAAKSLQSCPTLCDPVEGSPPGSPVPGILQARTLEWVAIAFSNAWKWKVKVKSLSCVRLLATPWTTANQAPPSMGFSRQEYWSGLPLSFPVAYTKAEQILQSKRKKISLFCVIKQWHGNADNSQILKLVIFFCLKFTVFFWYFMLISSY